MASETAQTPREQSDGWWQVRKAFMCLRLEVPPPVVDDIEATVHHEFARLRSALTEADRALKRIGVERDTELPDGETGWLAITEDGPEPHGTLDEALAHVERMIRHEAERARVELVGICASQASKIRDELANVATLRSELARKDAALREYGKHERDCTISGTPDCSCGFYAALASTEEG